MARALVVPLNERFFAKVHKTEGCWLWIARRNPKGYGQIRIGGRKGTTEQAHRISWVLHFGPIPEGKQVLHRCNLPYCVNPSHLYLGTNNDNVRYRVECGRQTRGEESPVAKLTEDDVLKIREMNGSTRKIGASFGISGMQVSSIKRRKYWAHV